MPEGFPEINLMTVVSFLIGAYVVYCLARIVLKNKGWYNAYRGMNWGLLLLEIPLVGLVIILVVVLYGLNPDILGFTWWRLLGSRNAQNILFVPFYIKYVGFLYVALILMALPYLAATEEVMFRQGTQDWGDGTLRSVSFGFVHMIVGVPVAAAIALSFVGLFYTYLYFRGGGGSVNTRPLSV